MQLKSVFVVPALLSALLLSACGEKSAEEATVVSPAEKPPAAEPAEAPPAVVESGGYVPAADELVLGITRTKEEQDKMNAEAMVGIPLPVIPGEAQVEVAPASNQ